MKTFLKVELAWTLTYYIGLRHSNIKYIYIAGNPDHWRAAKYFFTNDFELSNLVR